MNQYLPNKDGQPLWVKEGADYVVRHKDAEIRIKGRKNAKVFAVSMDDVSFNVSKEGIIETCRTLLKARKAAGGAKLWQVKIDTPDKGRLFTSEPEIGFKWL
jgi:hypothetical protein